MSNDKKKVIAQKIKRARIRSGYTQEQFAEKVGISAQQVSRIECGNFLPLLPTFFKIANVLNLTLKDFGVDKIEKDNKIINKLMKLMKTMSDIELECCYNVIMTQIKNYELISKQKRNCRLSNQVTPDSSKLSGITNNKIL